MTSDFLASGGDGVIGRLKLPASAITSTDRIIRDAMADVLRAQKGTVIDPAMIFGRDHKRLDYEGKRPIHCGGAATDQDVPIRHATRRAAGPAPTVCWRRSS